MSLFAAFFFFFFFFFFICFFLTTFTQLHFPLSYSSFSSSSSSSSSSSTAAAAAAGVHNRRTLHQPFFPLTSSSSLPPAQSPSSSFPRYPSSSSSSSSSTFRPFFPLYPSPPPPPPPAATLPTFPANISSAVSSRRSHPRLVTAVASPLLALAFLGLSLALFLHLRGVRRRRGGDKDARSDSLRFFPPDTTASDGRKLSATASSSAVASSAPAGSEFLYLGTLVSSRGRSSEASAAGGGGSPYRKLGSPELRPLPPLPRQFVDAEGGRFSSDEACCSPKDAPAGKEASVAPVTSSKKASLGVEMGRCGSRSSTLSTPTNISSNVISSPSQSSPTTSSPPLPPRPPPLLRPPTPSPPKRRPPSHSPPSSPPDIDGVKKVETSRPSSQSLRSPRKIGDFARSSVDLPPPPPPPPFLCPEGQNAKLTALEPPILLPPRPPAAWSFAEAQDNYNSTEKHDDNPRPKLKPLHWDKVRASSDRAMAWDQLKSGSFQLNEEMIEALFGSNASMASKVKIGDRINPSVNQESRILDPKKSQNIAILLKALNVTKEEVCEALSEGEADRLGNDILEALTKMVPSKEEEHELKEYIDGSPSKLGLAESFLKAVLDIPFAFKRVDAMLYIANFDSEVNHLMSLFRTLEAACEELRCSRMFHKILEAVLKTGNRMNIGTNHGEARAFKLDSLLKLVDVRGTDGKTSLLHFVVQEISRAEGSHLSAANSSDSECCKLGIQVVSNLGAELSNVKKAAAVDLDMLIFYVAKLGGGLGKVQEVLELNDSSANENDCRFRDKMIGFLQRAEEVILDIQGRESFTLSMVKEVTEYFYGDLSPKEEAHHPFRIFTVVRDFLALVDRVCREIEKINEHNVFISERHLPVSTNQTSQPVFPSFLASRRGCSDDEASLSS